MDLPLSPLAPARFPDLPAIPGLELAGAATGLKKGEQRDLSLFALAPGSAIAGVLTRSRCPSAPVVWCRRHLPAGRVRAIVVNAGNANAFTGQAGDDVVGRTAQAAADVLGCRADEVFLASTGVIGAPLPADAISSRLPGLAKQLRPDAWRDVADAIRTTDTFAKGAVRVARIGDTQVSLAGIAKGSGMIAPDMATMLSFVVTDADLPSDILAPLLKRGADRSFNSITVDSDTSTSDTLLLCATRQAEHQAPDRADHPLLRDFRRQLDALLEDLALQVVRDGEGAERLITITVTGATSRQAARRVGLSVANSPLVKTAIAGGDANWGRIVMAVGKAGERAERDRLAIEIGGTAVARSGLQVPGYDEAPVAAHIRGRDVRIGIDLGVGRGRATVWTCDLTHGYVAINADYRS